MKHPSRIYARKSDAKKIEIIQNGAQKGSPQNKKHIKLGKGQGKEHPR